MILVLTVWPYSQTFPIISLIMLQHPSVQIHCCAQMLQKGVSHFSVTAQQTEIKYWRTFHHVRNSCRYRQCDMHSHFETADVLLYCISFLLLRLGCSDRDSTFDFVQQHPMGWTGAFVLIRHSSFTDDSETIFQSRPSNCFCCWVKRSKGFVHF